MPWVWLCATKPEATNVQPMPEFIREAFLTAQATRLQRERQQGLGKPIISATAAWLSRQVTEAFPWDTAPRYLLRDRDASYGTYFCNRVEAMGITEVITAPRSSWQNSY